MIKVIVTQTLKAYIPKPIVLRTCMLMSNTNRKLYMMSSSAPLRRWCKLQTTCVLIYVNSSYTDVCEQEKFPPSLWRFWFPFFLPMHYNAPAVYFNRLTMVTFLYFFFFFQLLVLLLFITDILIHILNINFILLLIIVVLIITISICVSSITTTNDCGDNNKNYQW